MAHDVAVRAVVTPLLVGGASLAGRRWGPHVAGWLVALPLASGPVAFFLMTDHGTDFAAQAAVGMLAGTIGQVAFAVAYRAAAHRGWLRSFAVGCTGFAAVTVVLARLPWAAPATIVLVLAALAAGHLGTRRPARSAPLPAVARPPPWDIPVRMASATAVVLAVTALAPVIGAQLAGLLSPFPVFGAVLAVSTHLTHNSQAAGDVLDGLVAGLAAPAVFVLVLALALPPLGLLAFAAAAAAALVTQAATMFVLPAATTPRRAQPLLAAVSYGDREWDDVGEHLADELLDDDDDDVGDVAGAGAGEQGCPQARAWPPGRRRAAARARARR